MNTKILEEIGLTKTEIKIYLSLLKLGQSTTTRIVKESNVYASKVYEFLDKLVKKGLVSYVIKSNKKFFTAVNPEALKEIIKEKKEVISKEEKEIENLIPELKNIIKQKENTISTNIYEGLNGLKSIYNKILEELDSGETQYIIGAPRIGNELIEGFLIDWHKKRIKKGIKCKYIYDSNVKDYGKIRENMPLTEVKYLPNNIISPVWIEIFKDYVFIGHIKGNNSVLFLIHDKEIAKSYLDYFNLIWKISR